MTKKEKREKAAHARETAKQAKALKKLGASAGDPHTHAQSKPEIHHTAAPKKERTAESLDARWQKCIAKFPPTRTKFPTDESRELYIAEHR